MNGVKKLLCIAALLALLAGCGSNTENEVATTTTSTTTVTGDQSKIADVEIKTADLPAGWAETPADPAVSNLAVGLYDQLGECVGAPEAKTERTASNSGAAFAQSTNAIASGSSVFKTDETVTKEIAGLKDPANNACILELFQNVATRALTGVTGGVAPESTIGPLPGVTLAGNQFGLRVTTKITTATINDTVYTDLVGIGQGRVVATASFNYLGSVPPSDLESSVLETLTQRTAAAQG